MLPGVPCSSAATVALAASSRWIGGSRPLIAADRGQHPPPRQRDQLLRHRVLGSIEQAVAQDDALEEMTRVRVEHLRLHRPNRFGRLIDLRRRSWRGRRERRERSDDETLHAGRCCRVDEVPRPLDAKAIGRRKLFRRFRSGLRQRRQLVDDVRRVRGDDNAAQRLRRRARRRRPAWRRARAASRLSTAERVSAVT